MSAAASQPEPWRPETPPWMLVVAKAPVPGRVKTRLGVDIGMTQAASLAAASLLDTLEACRAAVGPERCHLSLDGDLTEAVAAAELTAAVQGWTITPQRGEGLAQRLAHAHADVPGPTVQVGMDTPQITPELLGSVVDGLAHADAVLGPAHDGGWWVLALRDPTRADALVGVEMSAPTTYDDTRAALVTAGLVVGDTDVLRDVDTVHEAELVAKDAPRTRFALAWQEVRP